MKIATALLMSLVITACGTSPKSETASVNAQKATPETQSEAVITGVEVKAANGGINPEFAAVKVKGKVSLATNSCFAIGLKAELVQRFVEAGNKIEVVAVKIATEDFDPSRICPLDYAPVIVDVETTVHYETEEVFVLNVGREHNNVSINDLF